MHCPRCGAEFTFGLKYCKRCGANLAAQETATPPAKLASAAWPIALATVAICLGGLGIVISHAFDLMRPLHPGETRVGDPTPIAITMIVFGALTVLGVVAMLLTVFSRMAGISKPKSQPDKDMTSAQPPVQLPPASAAMPSITENTTRSFDSVYGNTSGRE